MEGTDARIWIERIDGHTTKLRLKLNGENVSKLIITDEEFNTLLEAVRGVKPELITDEQYELIKK